MNKRYHYYTNCVAWPEHLVHCNGGLIDMIDQAKEIKRDTFLRRVDEADLMNLERLLGYESHYKQGLTMAADWAVSYHSSKLFGSRVYYFRYSSIEYVFRDNNKMPRP
jgi:hypothetical protein